MRIPAIVKQIGKVEGECFVYIEDYVYTYLNNLKNRKNIWPYRVALFGKGGRCEGKVCYFVYGAADVHEEMEAGKSQEQVREEFFSDYELIGYVNIYGNGRELPGKKDGYYIFYETNEPMQAYLLSCYERRNQISPPPDEKADNPVTESEKGLVIGNLLRRLFYGLGVIVLALAVTTIDDYDKMHRFTVVAEQAVILTQTKE